MNDYVIKQSRLDYALTSKPNFHVATNAHALKKCQSLPRDQSYRVIMLVDQAMNTELIGATVVCNLHNILSSR